MSEGVRASLSAPAVHSTHSQQPTANRQPIKLVWI